MRCSSVFNSNCIEKLVHKFLYYNQINLKIIIEKIGYFFLEGVSSDTFLQIYLKLIIIV